MNSRRPLVPRTRGRRPASPSSRPSGEDRAAGTPKGAGPGVGAGEGTSPPDVSRSRTKEPRVTKPGKPAVSAQRAQSPGGFTLSWRAVTLAVVVAVAFVLLAPTLRLYLSQKEAERRISEEITHTKARNEQLQREIEQWKDPAYIESRARERLGYVFPGQQPYLVVDPETIVGVEAEEAHKRSKGYTVPKGPWYFEIWDSVTVAGATKATGTNRTFTGIEGNK